jgi:prepilin-type N-terminal cleavage/methylation domain-containing protein
VPRSGGVVGRDRKGFTLVEVIVVLVILAILAAIAIPALTGYIDKAKWTDLKLRVKTAKTAVQTMLIDERVKNGGFILHDGNNVPAGDYYNTVTGTGIQGLDGYLFEDRFTSVGLKEYEKLTGDKLIRLESNPDYTLEQLIAYTDLNGAIKVFYYTYDSYYGDNWGGLWCFYIDDVTDPFVKEFISKDNTSFIGNYKDSILNTLTNGFNAYEVTWGPHNDRNYTAKKLF